MGKGSQGPVPIHISLHFSQFPFIIFRAWARQILVVNQLTYISTRCVSVCDWSLQWHYMLHTIHVFATACLWLCGKDNVISSAAVVRKTWRGKEQFLARKKICSNRGGLMSSELLIPLECAFGFHATCKEEAMCKHCTDSSPLSRLCNSTVHFNFADQSSPCDWFSNR